MSVSIIIPVYNGEKYLDKCVSSIKGELLPDDHIIIIDDGSKDKTQEICETYKNDSNIIVIRQKNKGVSEARNAGIRCVSDDYLMFVDSDDQFIHGWRKEIKKYEKLNNDLTVFGIVRRKITNKEVWLDCIFGFNDNVNGLRGPWSKLYKTNFLKENNIYFKKGIINGEDMLFNIDVAMAANKYAFINKSIYLYRNNNESCTRRFNSALFESDKRFHKYLSKYKTIITNRQREKCVKDAITMFVNKISSQDRNKREGYVSIFNERPYSAYVHANDKNLNRKMKFYRFIIKRNMYGLVGFINHIRRFLKNSKSKNEFRKI